MSITAGVLHHIAPQGHPELIEELAKYFDPLFDKYEINTFNRKVCFLGQSAEETAGFRTLTEYGSGREYEGRHDLGNIHPGDGVRYKGRGVFQITGLYNYRKMGEIIKVDLVANPEKAAEPQIAIETACLFWNERHLSLYADKMEIQTITKHINGGYNGLRDREIYTQRAEAALR